MSSYDFPNFDLNEPPPRPTTPPVRRGFLMVLLILCLFTGLVYGVPYVARNAGYAWEAGRAQADAESLAKLDKAGIINKASLLFREASVAVAPAVVNVGTRHAVNDRLGGREKWDLGSGVVIDKAHGYIVTNHHVVKDADDIIVKLGHGSEMTGQLVGADPQTDLAVVQVRAQLMAQAEWGDSDKVDVGDWVLAIGSPFALDRTVTAGIVSATSRNNLRLGGEASYEDFIQTDAAINPGNSGGPLVDLRGKVVGINTAILSESGGYQGIGLSISANLAKRVVEQLIAKGRVVRGYLGVTMQALDAVLARKLDLPNTQGVLIEDVEPESPADKAGLQVGDVLVELDGKPVIDIMSFRNRIASQPSGAKVPISYRRAGKLSKVEVTISEMPVLLSLGVRLRELKREGKKEPVIVVTDIVPTSPAHRAGLRPGMRVLEVAHQPVNSKSECDAIAQQWNPNKGLEMGLLLSNGQTAQVTLGGTEPAPR